MLRWWPWTPGLRPALPATPTSRARPRLVIDVMLRDATLSPGGSWTAASPTTTDQVATVLDDITAADVPDGVRLKLDGTAYFPELSWSDGALIALAFHPVDVVPVVVSARLADELGLKVGDGVQLALGLTPVPREGHRHQRPTCRRSHGPRRCWPTSTRCPAPPSATATSSP